MGADTSVEIITLIVITSSNLLISLWKELKTQEFQSSCCGGKGCNLIEKIQLKDPEDGSQKLKQ